MGGAAGAPHPLPIYFMSKMHTRTIQKKQKAYINTYEKDVNIYKDIDNSQGRGAFFCKQRYVHLLGCEGSKLGAESSPETDPKACNSGFQGCSKGFLGRESENM